MYESYTSPLHDRVRLTVTCKLWAAFGWGYPGYRATTGLLDYRAIGATRIIGATRAIGATRPRRAILDCRIIGATKVIGPTAA